MRTALGVGVAGLGTLTAGTLAATQPSSSANSGAVSPGRLVAAGIGTVAFGTGIGLAVTAPGGMLKPLAATVGALLGGLLIGQHVLGPMLGPRQ